MEKYVYKGKNVEDLLKLACEELNVSESDIFYSTHEERTGLFSGKKIVVELIKVSDTADFGKQILENILKGFNIEGQIEKKIRDKQIFYSVHSDNNGALIGKNGRILDNIQKYLRQAINAQIVIHVNIVLDIENYKEKQNRYLERDVKRIAREVTLSKKEVKLDPMNSYQRRIVHNALSKFDYISTESIGEEPNRCVVIKYKEKEEENK